MMLVADALTGNPKVQEVLQLRFRMDTCGIPTLTFGILAEVEVK